jgi:hypothetical protein
MGYGMIFHYMYTVHSNQISLSFSLSFCVGVFGFGAFELQLLIFLFSFFVRCWELNSEPCGCLVVLFVFGFEFRASYLLIGVLLLEPHLQLFGDKVSLYNPGWPWDWDPLPQPPHCWDCRHVPLNPAVSLLLSYSSLGVSHRLKNI